MGRYPSKRQRLVDVQGLFVPHMHPLYVEIHQIHVAVLVGGMVMRIFFFFGPAARTIVAFCAAQVSDLGLSQNAPKNRLSSKRPRIQMVKDQNQL